MSDDFFTVYLADGTEEIVSPEEAEEMRDAGLLREPPVSDVDSISSEDVFGEGYIPGAE